MVLKCKHLKKMMRNTETNGQSTIKMWKTRSNSTISKRVEALLFNCSLILKQIIIKWYHSSSSIYLLCIKRGHFFAPLLEGFCGFRKALELSLLLKVGLNPEVFIFWVLGVLEAVNSTLRGPLLLSEPKNRRKQLVELGDVHRPMWPQHEGITVCLSFFLCIPFLSPCWLLCGGQTEGLLERRHSSQVPRSAESGETAPSALGCNYEMEIQM